jgi:hypothetical protein
MSEHTFPFRRMTKAVLVPVSETPTQGNRLTVPEGYVKPDYNAFAVYNPNIVDVALRGTSMVDGQPAPTEAILAAEGDWEFPPKFWGVFSTQYPMFMSAIALVSPGYPLTGSYKPLRVWYGYGA